MRFQHFEAFRKVLSLLEVEAQSLHQAVLAHIKMYNKILLKILYSEHLFKPVLELST
jgi:hypothetical protein